MCCRPQFPRVNQRLVLLFLAVGTIVGIYVVCAALNGDWSLTINLHFSCMLLNPRTRQRPIPFEYPRAIIVCGIVYRNKSRKRQGNSETINALAWAFF